MCDMWSWNTSRLKVHSSGSRGRQLRKAACQLFITLMWMMYKDIVQSSAQFRILSNLPCQSKILCSSLMVYVCFCCGTAQLYRWPCRPLACRFRDFGCWIVFPVCGLFFSNEYFNPQWHPLWDYPNKHQKDVHHQIACTASEFQIVVLPTIISSQRLLCIFTHRGPIYKNYTDNIV